MGLSAFLQDGFAQTESIGNTEVVARLRETRQTAKPLQNLGGLLARYDEQANSILPILAPMPDVMQVVPGAGYN